MLGNFRKPKNNPCAVSIRGHLPIMGTTELARWLWINEMRRIGCSDHASEWDALPRHERDAWIVAVVGIVEELS